MVSIDFASWESTLPLLSLDWGLMSRTSWVDHESLPAGVVFDASKETLVFTERCSFCWRQELLAASHVDTEYRDMQ